MFWEGERPKPTVLGQFSTSGVRLFCKNIVITSSIHATTLPSMPLVTHPLTKKKFGKKFFI
jgi:hypothetical protein